MKIEHIKQYLLQLQNTICSALTEIDGAQFKEDNWQHKSGVGGGCTRVLSGGTVIEKGGVNFSHIKGSELPAAATQKRPELTGLPFEALGVSLVIHPKNPFAPTSHMNVRFFQAGAEEDEKVWWFGGGFDMTPYYGFKQDAEHWHKMAFQACEPFGVDVYEKFKTWCDEYFYLPHRDEQRGIGGLFFDDLNQWGFEQCFAFVRSVGDHYLPAYLPILERRKDSDFDDKHQLWQWLRRGRYVEFNLVQDRGTLFGLQSRGRTESILMSLPPRVAWEYRSEPEPGSAEHELLHTFLIKKDWLK